MLLRPTNAHHMRDHLAERAIYIKPAHQRGTFGVKINLETVQKILTISIIAKTLSNIREHQKQ